MPLAVALAGTATTNPTLVRDAYVAHISAMLVLAGFDDENARARRVMDLETRIASHHWDRVACRDTQKTYNLLDGKALQALAPSFDFDAWAAAAGVPTSALAETIVSQPSYVEGLAQFLVDDELEAWRDWLRWQLVHTAAPYLSSAFVEENFAFYGTTLSGATENRPRW